MTGSTKTSAPAGVSLATLLDEWVAEDILTAQQASRIAARAGGPDMLLVRASRSQVGQPTLAVEALGYVGGGVVVVGSLLVGEVYWASLSPVVRTAVVGVAAVALLGGGASVSARLGAVSDRLRSALWVAAVVAVAGFLALLTADVLEVVGQHAAVVSAVGTSAAAATLWRLHRRLAQQVATMVALMVAGASTTSAWVGSRFWLGVAVWLVAATWLSLGWGSLVHPRRAVFALASAAMVAGAVLSLPTHAGYFLAVGTVTGVVILAVCLADLLLLAVGVVSSLLVLPAAFAEWFPDSHVAPFALLGVGLLLVAIAVWTARRRGLGGGRPAGRGDVG